MKQPRITIIYILICAIAVFLSFFLHELSHWISGEMLGNNMALGLNKVYPINGAYNVSWHYTIVSAAGPLFTLLQAVVFYLLLRNKDNTLLYPFLLTPLYMRVLGAAMSIRHPNDEARISTDLGIGTCTLPVAVCAFLFWLVYAAHKKRGWSLKFGLLTLGLIIVFSSVLILADQFLQMRIF